MTFCRVVKSILILSIHVYTIHFRLSMGKRYCCVFNCHNHDGMIKEWQNSTCPIHHVINGLEHCNCKPPFFLLTFPSKDLKLRGEWIQRINRNPSWQPTYDTRICSVHFVDADIVKKKTSPAYPYPTQNMGYSGSSERAKPKLQTTEQIMSSNGEPPETTTSGNGRQLRQRNKKKCEDSDESQEVNSGIQCYILMSDNTGFQFRCLH